MFMMIILSEKWRFSLWQVYTKHTNFIKYNENLLQKFDEKLMLKGLFPKFAK